MSIFPVRQAGTSLDVSTGVSLPLNPTTIKIIQSYVEAWIKFINNTYANKTVTRHEISIHFSSFTKQDGIFKHILNRYFAEKPESPWTKKYQEIQNFFRSHLRPPVPIKSEKSSNTSENASSSSSSTQLSMSRKRSRGSCNSLTQDKREGKNRKLSSAVPIKLEKPTEPNSDSYSFTSIMELLDNCKSKEDDYKVFNREQVVYLGNFFAKAISSIEGSLKVLENEKSSKIREVKQKRLSMEQAVEKAKKLKSWDEKASKELKEWKELKKASLELYKITNTIRDLSEMKCALRMHSGAIKNLTRNPNAQRFILQEFGTFENLDIELGKRKYDWTYKT